MTRAVDVGSRVPRADAHVRVTPPVVATGASSRRRSVCLYTPSADPSGMGAHMLDLVAEYVPDLDVTLLAWPTAPGQRLLDRAESLGARTVALPHPRAADFARVVAGHLRSTPTDVFHVHVGTGREDFDGARAARRAGVPVVLQTQHYPWLMGSPKHLVPFFHAIEPVDHLLTVSEAQRRTYERVGVLRERMTTVPNGIRERGPGAGRQAAREALGLTPDQPVVLTVGRLTTMKGHTHLLDAVPDLVARFPDLAVVLIGTGHLHDRLRAQAEALGVSGSVHLAGQRSDARLLLDAADVFVLPSRHEGMPLVLLEAMDAGLPVVATRVIGSEEVVVDGETGFLVRARSAPALADGLGRLLDDGGLRARFGAAGRQRFVERFTSDRMAAETIAVYDLALSLSARARSAASADVSAVAR